MKNIHLVVYGGGIQPFDHEPSAITTDQGSH